EESDVVFEHPVWSPDGRSIYAIGETYYDGDSHYSIYRIDVRTENVTNVTPPQKNDFYYRSGFGQPAVTPSGTLLVPIVTPLYDCGYRCWGVFELNPDGSNPRPLFGTVVTDRFETPRVLPSPVGAGFMTTVRIGVDDESPPSSDIDLIARDGTSVNLTNNPSWVFASDPAFSPDGGSIVFTHEGETTLYERDNGAPTDLFVMSSAGGA